MYALVEIKGKQYKAEKDSVIRVDKLGEEIGATVEFDSVVLLTDGEKVTVGQPYVAGSKVVATVEDLKKDKKVLVLKFKRRKGYMRRKGHRQQYSFIKITDVIGA